MRGTNCTKLLVIALLTPWFSQPLPMQATPVSVGQLQRQHQRLHPTVGQSIKNDTSTTLAHMARSSPAENARRPAFAEIANRVLPNKRADPKQVEELKAQGDAIYDQFFGPQRDPVLQLGQHPDAPFMPAALISFDGVHNVNNVSPPDPSGDVGFDAASGKKYYMQWVNLSYAVWDVTNPQAPQQVMAPRNGNTLWQGFGGLCETENDGDPIVVWDQLAQRWLVTQFAVPVTGPFVQCVAVSATANPLGAWHRYAFLVSTIKFNDYAKFGVWPTGYFASMNLFVGNDFRGAGLMAFDRDKMLQGLPAPFVLFDLDPVNRAYGGMLPIDLDGNTLPPAGMPNLFVEVDDNASTPDLGPADALRIWRFSVDWANPSAATLGQYGEPDFVLPVAPFNVLPCIASGARNCIPQPGGFGVDGIGDRLMFRAAYRNFGTHEALLLNHTVNAGSSTSASDNANHRAGIRWYELRNLSTSPIIYQQGTFAPNDGLHRWVASIAQDRVGNAVMGYSVAGASVNPGVRYTGRLSTDSLGQMTQGEAELVMGTGIQTSSTRWGDYTQLTTDPVDDCTFWYTNQYYAVSSGNGWRTRIGAFRFPNCGTGQPVQIRGRLLDAPTQQGIEGGRVTATAPTTDPLFTSSDTNGDYTLPVLAGNYMLETSRYGYLPATVGPISVTEGGSPPLPTDILLVRAPLHTISGFVRDTNTSRPLSATVSVAGEPHSPPTTTVFTDPATGFYSITLAQGQSYTLTAVALLHAHGARAIGALAGDAQFDFALAPATTATNGAILGYVYDLYTALPLSNAVVMASAVTGTTQLAAVSASNGRFSLIGLSPGTFSVTALAAGFVTATVASVAVGAGDLVVRDFALSRPRLQVSPAALSQTVVFGGAITNTVAITLHSAGASPISYAVREMLVHTGTDDAPAASGGPDAFGYTWRSSALAGGPQLNWIDIISDGAALGLTDEGMANILLPFEFPFYDSAFARLRISSNGALLVGADSGHIIHLNAPIVQAPFNFIAPFWDDLDGSAGNIYWKVVGTAPTRRVVITWHQRPHYANVDKATFQAVLFEDGDILFQYLDVGFGSTQFDNGKSATIGIHGPNVSSFLQFSHNEDKVHDGMALCFDRPIDTLACGRDSFDVPWLVAAPQAGSLVPGSTEALQVVWRSSAASTPQPGTYLGGLVVHANDPLAKNVLVPVTLTVLPAANFGRVHGVVRSSGACDSNGISALQPLSGASVQISNGSGFSVTVPSTVGGVYDYWLDAGEYTLSFSATSHIPATLVSVVVAAGSEVTQDAVLRLDRACMTVLPQQVDVTVRYPESALVPLTVGSRGAQPLDVVFTEHVADAHLVGPDAAGYVLVANAVPRFIDIGNSGMALALGLQDDETSTIRASFPISLYGVATNTLRIGNNGAILLGAGSGSVAAGNSTLQTASNFLIAPFWDDLSAERGNVYWKELGVAPNRMLIVQWHDRPHYSDIGTATFQVQLYENGVVIFAYQDVDFGNTLYNRGASATVGVRGAGETQSLQLSFNQPRLADGFSVCIALWARHCGSVGWLNTDPAQMNNLSGTPPSSAMGFMQLDSLSVGVGVHKGLLVLASNSSDPVAQVPITFTVLPPQRGTVLYFPFVLRN